MQRIGFVASKMARGNLWAYNLFVVLLSLLCSILIFLVCGFVVLAVLFLISMLFRLVSPEGLGQAWFGIVKICLIAVAFLVGLLNIAAIVRNIKLSRKE